MYMIAAILLIIGTIGWLHLLDRSRKPITGNPVVFMDSGNPLYFILAILSSAGAIGCMVLAAH